ncbi:MAG: YibE/F family protein [Kiritimatiellae bacterium]|nr:YibE/F family protein [Kiritimatiellia bacterium]
MRLGKTQANLAVLAVLALASAALWLIPEPPHLASPHGSPERARVLSVDNASVESLGLLRYGSQRLEVELLSGAKKGQTFRAANEIRAQMELDKDFKPGDEAVVIVHPDDAPGSAMLVARDHYRLGYGWLLFGLLCLLLCIFGGWTGIKALLSFVVSCLVIWKGVIPLAMRGWPASWTIFGSVCLLTAIIVYLVAGATRKGWAAFLGSATGIFVGLGMAHLFGRLMKINGATMPYVQTLLHSGYEFLNLQDIYIGGIILASSGAVMDLAMDIASGIEEVARHNPTLPMRELVMSGIRIGRSVVGTMTTTLLLAYSGGYITLLMMFRTQGTPPADFLNNAIVASEVVKTLIGSFSLVLVAPCTALVAGWVFKPDTRENEK